MENKSCIILHRRITILQQIGCVHNVTSTSACSKQFHVLIGTVNVITFYNRDWNKQSLDFIMKYYASGQRLKKELRDKVLVGLLILKKSNDKIVHTTKPNTYVLNLENLISNECKMVLRELQPYLILPPDGPQDNEWQVLMTFDICIFSWTEQKLPYQDLLIISNHELMCNKSGNSFAVWVPPNIINIAYLYPKHIYCDIKCYYIKYYKNENIQSNLKPDCAIHMLYKRSI